MVPKAEWQLLGVLRGTQVPWAVLERPWGFRDLDLPRWESAERLEVLVELWLLTLVPVVLEGPEVPWVRLWVVLLRR